MKTTKRQNELQAQPHSPRGCSLKAEYEACTFETTEHYRLAPKSFKTKYAKAAETFKICFCSLIGKILPLYRRVVGSFPGQKLMHLTPKSGHQSFKLNYGIARFPRCIFFRSNFHPMDFKLFRDVVIGSKHDCYSWRACSSRAPGAISSLVGRPNDVEGYMHQRLTYTLNDCKSGMLYDVVDVMEASDLVKIVVRDRYPYCIPKWKSGRARLNAALLKSAGSVNTPVPSVQIGSFPPISSTSRIGKCRGPKPLVTSQFEPGVEDQMLLYPNVEELISKISSCQLEPD